MKRTNRILAIAGGALALGVAFPGAAHATPFAPPLCDGKLPTILVKPGVATFGTEGNDVILGTQGEDAIHGGAGNDSVCSLGGNDRVVGGVGNDRLFGGAGDDTLELRDASTGDFGNGDAGFDIAFFDQSVQGGADQLIGIEKLIPNL